MANEKKKLETCPACGDEFGTEIVPMHDGTKVKRQKCRGCGYIHTDSQAVVKPKKE